LYVLSGALSNSPAGHILISPPVSASTLTGLPRPDVMPGVTLSPLLLSDPGPSPRHDSCLVGESVQGLIPNGQRPGLPMVACRVLRTSHKGTPSKDVATCPAPGGWGCRVFLPHCRGQVKGALNDIEAFTGGKADPFYGAPGEQRGRLPSMSGPGPTTVLFLLL
jgi:hypothetical protein